MPDQLESNTRTVMVITAFSRVTGLLRDAVLAFFFGVTELMSSFAFAFLIPNLFRRLFGEGALGASFLPVYSQLHKNNPERASQLASLLIAGLLVVLGAIVVVGESVLFLMSAMRDHNDNAIWLLMVMLPYMPLVCLVAILGAMLHVHGRFGPPAMAPLLLNGAMIATAVGVGLSTGELTAHARLVTMGAIACSVVIAGLLQAIWMLWSLRRTVNWTWNRADATAPLRRVLKAAGPMMLGLGVLQLNTFMDGIIASYPNLFGTDTVLGQPYPLDTGSMAILGYAQRLYQFPLGVFGIAVATAIYPLLAHQSDDEQAFTSTVRRGLRLVLFIGLPASIGLALVREPLVACIFQRGAFTSEDTVQVGAVLLGYAVAIWAYSANHVLTRTYYAKLDMKTPVRIAIQMVGLNLLLNLVLIWTPLRTAGLAWSTAACAILQCILLLRASRVHVENPLDSTVRNSAMRSCALAMVMGAAVGLVMLGLDHSESLWTNLLNLSLLIAVGAAVYGGGAVAMGMPELRWALGRR
ncbi:MAG: murein biosynthesis integral membrane protein MurJ [Phycisphaerales bacterium]|nr:murein biosynthesis integral membrane protein MurJ [Phycisphaerales bacterium]